MGRRNLSVGTSRLNALQPPTRPLLATLILFVLREARPSLISSIQILHCCITKPENATIRGAKVGLQSSRALYTRLVTAFKSPDTFSCDATSGTVMHVQAAWHTLCIHSTPAASYNRADYLVLRLRVCIPYPYGVLLSY